MKKFVYVEDIKRIEFGITSLCNAGCPMCARHIDGTSIVKPDLPMRSISIDDFIQIAEDIGPHTRKINCNLCGTIGDPIAHPQIEKIINYSAENYKVVTLDTNGSLRDTKFWTRLGEKHQQVLKQGNGRRGIEVNFSIDGLEDTNQLYRINTDYNKIIDNAQAFINAGGKAIWKFIIFEHNQHQVNEAKQRADDMGFAEFSTLVSSRFRLNTGEAISVDSYKKKVNAPSREKVEQTQDKQFNLKASDKYSNKEVADWYIKFAKPGNQEKELAEATYDINCKSIDKGYLYIDEIARLWPCCHFHGGLTGHTFTKFWADIEKQFGKDFNSLRTSTINELLDHEYFKEYLPNSWTNPQEYKLCKKCVQVCDKNKGMNKDAQQKAYTELR